jgi:hypothetical protein
LVSAVDLMDGVVAPPTAPQPQQHPKINLSERDQRVKGRFSPRKSETISPNPTPVAPLQPLAIDKMPLDVTPPHSTRFGSPLVPSRVHRVRPELVTEVKFLTWTEDNLLRQVVYQGLREDKPAAEVRRDVPHPKADIAAATKKITAARIGQSRAMPG